MNTWQQYYKSPISDEPLEATTLEDIGFDGDPLHVDESYGCHVICNEACHIGSGDVGTHRAQFYVGTVQEIQEQREQARRAHAAIQEIAPFVARWSAISTGRCKTPSPDYYTTVQAPDPVIAAASSALEFAYYVLQRKQRVARDLDELWAWANTPHPGLEDMTPNYALLNGRSDVAWALMRAYLW